MGSVGDRLEFDPHLPHDAKGNQEEQHPSARPNCHNGPQQTKPTGRHADVMREQFSLADGIGKPDKQRQDAKQNEQRAENVDGKKDGQSPPGALNPLIRSNHRGCEKELAHEHPEVVGQERSRHQTEHFTAENALMTNPPRRQDVRRQHAGKSPGKPIGRGHDQQEGQHEGEAKDPGHPVS